MFSLINREQEKVCCLVLQCGENLLKLQKILAGFSLFSVILLEGLSKFT